MPRVCEVRWSPLATQHIQHPVSSRHECRGAQPLCEGCSHQQRGGGGVNMGGWGRTGRFRTGSVGWQRADPPCGAVWPGRTAASGPGRGTGSIKRHEVGARRVKICANLCSNASGHPKTTLALRLSQVFHGIVAFQVGGDTRNLATTRIVGHVALGCRTGGLGCRAGELSRCDWMRWAQVGLGLGLPATPLCLTRRTWRICTHTVPFSAAMTLWGG